MTIEQRLLRFVTRSSWIIFAIAASASLVLFSADFTKGVVCGGLIVTLNFHMLHRSLKKSFQPGQTVSFHAVIAKYYLRLLAVAILIFILVSQHLVHPLGLFAGLSVVVASLMLAAILGVCKTGPFRETPANKEKTNMVSRRSKCCDKPVS